MSYKNLQEALNAGMVNAKEHRIQTIGNYEISVRDTSEYPWFGYDYSIVVVPAKHTLHPFYEGKIPPCPDNHFAEAKSVWFSEDLNKVNQPGCVRMMFIGNEYAVGIEEAKKWIAAQGEK